MENVPCEILEKILSDNFLDVGDLFNLASTCKKLKDTIIRNNYIWKDKFKQRWPKLYILRHGVVNDWCTELRKMYRLRKQAYNLLRNMSKDYYPPRELNEQELEDWTALVNSELDYYYTFQFLLEFIDEDELIADADAVPFLTRGNLTLSYYIFRILYFISTRKLEYDWQNFLSKSEDFKTLEEVASLLAQRFQCDVMIIPDIISAELDRLAQSVTDYLRETIPDHPLFSVPKETLELWKRCKPNGQHYNAEDSMMVLQAIVYVLCKQEHFTKPARDYFHADNFNINLVLYYKKGSVITLSIIYQSVARRLGICLEPVSYKSMAYLLYTYEATNHLVNVLRGTITVTENNYTIIDITTLISSMLRNMSVGIIKNQHSKYGLLLKRAIFEWKLIVEPQNAEALMDLAHTYGEMKIDQAKLHPYFASQNDTPNIVNICDRVYKDATASENAETSLEIRRNRKAKYAIGMVMRLNMCGSYCVICDWEPTCKNLKGNIGRQANYTVLFDDGSCHNIPECFLDLASHPRCMTHPDLGKHFSHFNQTHYVPNELKEEFYPEDKEVRLAYQNQIMEEDSQPFLSSSLYAQNPVD